MRLLERSLRTDHPEPRRYPVDVGVDRELRPVEREEQHTCRRLPSDPGQPLEKLDRILAWSGLEPAELERRLRSDRGEHRLNPPGLDSRDPTGTDRLLDL